VIDKLEVAVDPETPLNARFESEYRQMRQMPHKLYKEKTLLRPLGMDAILFRYCRYNARHKLSIVQVSQMTIQDVAKLIEKVFDCDPWDLRLARVDFAVDLPNVSMPWVRAHVRVPRKRWKDERGFDKQSGDSTQGMSLYIGSKADLFRFYDKAAQLNRRGACGGDVALTRIERQLRTSRIPIAISTLSGLSMNVSEFNPFASLSFATGGEVEPGFEGNSARRALEGTGFRNWVQEQGYAKTWERLNALSRGNAARIVRRLGNFVPPDPEGLEVPDLFAIHRESLMHQVGATQ
jgi:hypothetical protein